MWFRSYFTRTVTTTSTASAVSAVTVRWQMSPSPARTMLFCAMTATAMSSPPNVWPAIKPSCLVWMTSAHIISHNSCSFLTNLVQTGLVQSHSGTVPSVCSQYCCVRLQVFTLLKQTACHDHRYAGNIRFTNMKVPKQGAKFCQSKSEVPAAWLKWREREKWGSVAQVRCDKIIACLPGLLSQPNHCAWLPSKPLMIGGDKPVNYFSKAASIWNAGNNSKRLRMLFFYKACKVSPALKVILCIFLMPARHCFSINVVRVVVSLFLTQVWNFCNLFSLNHLHCCSQVWGQ